MNEPTPTTITPTPVVPTTLISIKLHVRSLMDFFGIDKWNEMHKYATFDKPMDVIQFCTVQWQNQDFYPVLNVNSVIKWNIDYEFISKENEFDIDTYAVFHFFSRPHDINNKRTHEDDWNELLDFTKDNGKPRTDGIVSYDGKLHIRPLENETLGIKEFQIKAKPCVSKDQPGAGCLFNLSYTIFLTLKSGIENNVYCKIDPVIRNNTDQGDSTCN